MKLKSPKSSLKMAKVGIGSKLKGEDRQNSHRRGYDHQWKLARLEFLRKNPLCVECKKAGRIEAATDVDHIVPHRGDKRLFWDQTNWQSLCHPCHSEKTARGE